MKTASNVSTRKLFGCNLFLLATLFPVMAILCFESNTTNSNYDDPTIQIQIHNSFLCSRCRAKGRRPALVRTSPRSWEWWDTPRRGTSLASRPSMKVFIYSPYSWTWRSNTLGTLFHRWTYPLKSGLSHLYLDLFNADDLGLVLAAARLSLLHLDYAWDRQAIAIAIAILP